MTPRHSYILTIFEKLGAPLLAAAAESSERDRLSGVAVTDDAEAERMAELLKATAEMGFSLSHQMDLRMVDDAAADGVRLSLATVAAPLIANLYRVNGRVPSTHDIERMLGAMQTVTLFADNYDAAADANIRLQNIDQDFIPADPAQIQLMVLHALMPAMNAVCTFSFGQNEKIMLQDVTERLSAAATNVRDSLFSDFSERDSMRAHLALVRAAAALYSQIHFTEMSKLMFLDESDRDQVNLKARLDDMWKIVDDRLAMLHVLAEVVVTGQHSVIPTGEQGQGKRGGGSRGPLAPAAAATVRNPVTPQPVVHEQPPVDAAVQKPEESGAKPAAPANPMSFFAAKTPASGGEL